MSVWVPIQRSGVPTTATCSEKRIPLLWWLLLPAMCWWKFLTHRRVKNELSVVPDSLYCNYVRSQSTDLTRGLVWFLLFFPFFNLLSLFFFFFFKKTTYSYTTLLNLSILHSRTAQTAAKNVCTVPRDDGTCRWQLLAAFHLIAHRGGLKSLIFRFPQRRPEMAHGSFLTLCLKKMPSRFCTPCSMVWSMAAKVLPDYRALWKLL